MSLVEICARVVDEHIDGAEATRGLGVGLLAAFAVGEETPAARMPAHSDANSASFASDRAATITLAPCCANASAVARPNPELLRSRARCAGSFARCHARHCTGRLCPSTRSKPAVRCRSLNKNNMVGAISMLSYQFEEKESTCAHSDEAGAALPLVVGRSLHLRESPAVSRSIRRRDRCRLRRARPRTSDPSTKTAL